MEREGHRKTRLVKDRVDLDPERTQLHEQRWRGVQLTDNKPDEARHWRAKRRN